MKKKNENKFNEMNLQRIKFKKMENAPKDKKKQQS